MKGKVVLVTGGTSGIGRATAIAYAREGAKVVVSGRRESEGQETVNLIRKAGGEAVFIQADVAIAADVESLVKRTVETFGGLHIAFNNAGLEETPTPFEQQTEENYDKVIDTNVKGMFLSLKHEIPAIIASGGGAIVNMASAAGLVGLGMGASTYVASKHAVVGFTKALAIEYAQRGVRINAVAPAVIETDMARRFVGEDINALAGIHPMNRVGQVGEVSEAVLFLSSDKASFITGMTLAIDGGFTAG